MLRCNFSIAVRWHDRRRTARNRLILSLSLSWTLIIKRIHLTAILIIGRRHKGTLGVYIRAYSVPTDRIKDRLSAYRTNLRRVAVPIRLAPMRNHRRHPAIAIYLAFVDRKTRGRQGVCGWKILFRWKQWLSQRYYLTSIPYVNPYVLISNTRSTNRPRGCQPFSFIDTDSPYLSIRVCCFKRVTLLRFFVISFDYPFDFLSNYLRNFWFIVVGTMYHSRWLFVYLLKLFLFIFVKSQSLVFS